MAGICRIGFEFGAEGGDEIIDSPQTRIGVITPDDIKEFLAADGLAWMRSEQTKDTGFLIG